MHVGDGEGGITDRLVIRSDLNKAEMKSHLERTETRRHAANGIDLEVHLVRHGSAYTSPYLAHQLSTKDARQFSEGYPTKVD